MHSRVRLSGRRVGLEGTVSSSKEQKFSVANSSIHSNYSNVLLFLRQLTIVGVDGDQQAGHSGPGAHATRPSRQKGKPTYYKH
jgi:hypothetical protein